MKNINPLYILNENEATGALIGAGIGSLAGTGIYALSEWYAKFLRELIIVIKNAKTPFEVKKWFNENIIQNNQEFTRRRFLDPGMDSYGYVNPQTGIMVSKQTRNLGKRINDAIDSVVANRTADWRNVLLRYCQKELRYHRIQAGFLGVSSAIGGAAIGAFLGNNP